MSKYWGIALTALSGSLASLGIGALIFTFAVDTRPPLIGLSITPLNSPIFEGTRLIGHAIREKVRDDCPIVSVRKATHMDTGKEYALAGQIWSGGKAGSTSIDVVYATENLTAGQYVLEYKINYLCPWGQTFRYDGSMFFAVESA